MYFGACKCSILILKAAAATSPWGPASSKIPVGMYTNTYNMYARVSADNQCSWKHKQHAGIEFLHAREVALLDILNAYWMLMETK